MTSILFRTSFCSFTERESGERGLQGAEPYIGVRVVEQLVEADCALEGESFHEVESEVGDVLPDALKFRSEGGVVHPPCERPPAYLGSFGRSGQVGFGRDVRECHRLTGSEGVISDK